MAQGRIPRILGIAFPVHGCTRSPDRHVELDVQPDDRVEASCRLGRKS